MCVCVCVCVCMGQLAIPNKTTDVCVCELKSLHVNTNELDKPLYRQVCCVYV